MRPPNTLALDFDELRASNDVMKPVRVGTARVPVSQEQRIMLALMTTLGKLAAMISCNAVDRDLDSMPAYGSLLAGIVINIDMLAKYAGLDLGELVRCTARLQPPRASISMSGSERDVLGRAHHALTVFAELADRTFARDETGNRTADVEPDCSAADIFEELHRADATAREALALVTGILFPTKEGQ